MTLTEFLLARLADDEKWARRAAGETALDGQWSYTSGGDVSGAEGIPCVYRDGSWTPVVTVMYDLGVHIARHDPYRVLMECASKRAIAEEHNGPHDCVQYVDPEDNRDCATLRHLATAYLSHPDYRQEWKP